MTPRILHAMVASPLFLGATHASSFDTLWQLGSDDDSLAPFSQESFGPNPAPGSAGTLDDDYYVAGSYPSPVGTLIEDESIANFERAVTSGDPRNRIHFPLTVAQSSPDSLFRITLDLTGGGAWLGYDVPGFSSHDIIIRFNGNTIATKTALTWKETIAITLPATSVSAIPGANILEIERSGGAPGGYLGVDFLKLECDPIALQDTDDDGMPRWFEETYAFDPASAADALLDPDGDGLSNLAEFQAGTNPTDPDSDNDALKDSAEAALGTHPLLADTDGDGLSDSAETTSSPLLGDTDSDGIPDNIEVENGSNPSNAASKPFDFPGAISLQFVSEQLAAATLPPIEPAGLFRLPHWNASAPLPHWTESGTVLSGSKSSLINHRGQSTGAAVTWTYHFAGEGLHKDPGNERLLGGMLRTQASAGTAATVTISDVPYTTYDILVYVGYIYPGQRGIVSMDSNPSSERFFKADSAPPFIGWKEITATTQAALKSANYVRYRNLKGNSHTIALQAIANDTVGIHGIQIIDSGTDTDGDGMKDATEIEFRFNPAVPDANADADLDGISNLTEISTGTDPHHSDTDRDGINDGTEAGSGTSPLDADSDDDTLNDGDEIHHTFPSNPVLTDSDGDGFSDAAEREHASDPLLASSIPPPVPVWDGATRTWRWRIDHLRLLWNHEQSMLGAIESSESMLCEAVADINQSGWSRQVAIGIRYVHGKLVHRFRCVEGAFHQAGTDPQQGFWDSDWNSSPTDRTGDLGFSGYGTADDSKPLRFEFTATRPNEESDLWTLTFLIADLSNPSSPVTLATWTRTNAEATDTTLTTGNSLWKNQKGQSGRIDLNTETGVKALITPTAIGTPDADNDGMPDDWESTHAFNPNLAADASLDADSDGLTNLREFLVGTHPRDSDSDDDGANDSTELRHGSDPLSASSLPAWFTFQGTIDDLDGDGLSDAWLLWSGGLPRAPAADDDGDGMTNLQESLAGTDPDEAGSRFDMATWRSGDDLVLSWTDLPLKSDRLEASGSLDIWEPVTGTPLTASGRKQLTLSGVFQSPASAAFYRAGAEPLDSDGDDVEDWVENQVLGSSLTQGTSLGQSLSRSNGQILSGDALALLNRLQGSSPTGGTPGSNSAGTPSPIHAARFLMQASFGPTPESIDQVRTLGYSTWIDQQINLPASRLMPYIQEIKADAAGPRADRSYNYNEQDKFVFGHNITTPFARNAISGADQLRQRAAFALSQILVVSRRDANLEEKAGAMASYYDTLSKHALGNYGALLHDITLHPAMGWYLSSVGNQKADPSIPRYPDENYAREFMQLFTIGLWELNSDGSRKTDGSGEPIPTYDNGDITELARVFTGMYFASPYGWGGGGWADEHFTVPMVMYPERHDFGVKHLPGNFVIPAREPGETNGLQDIRDAVDALFRHPNTPPFICRQLIQFLITDNPSPAYVRRIQDVFVNDGTGIRGNLAAVVKAILLDPEARTLPLSPKAGKVREPVIRTMHLGRLFRLADAHPNFVWWNWTENFYGFSLQEPMNSPSVFNFYTPVYQAPGEIRQEGLVSPGFQIINTYSGVSFPNLIWDYLHDGFKSGWTWNFPMDFSRTLFLSEDPAALLDHIDLLVCAGNLSARTRGIMLAALNNPALTRKDRVALAVWTAMNSPEGVIQR